MKRQLSRVLLLALALLATGCKREARRFSDPEALRGPEAIAATDLRPGGAAPPALPPNPYQDNAWATSEGKRLYTWYNCVGCHAHGGGGFGPPLMDAHWIYGSEPAQIFSSIVEGRPNGMPAFGGRINAQEVWQLVAYVRALGGMARLDVATGRSDHMQVAPAEQAMPQPTPHGAQ